MKTLQQSLGRNQKMGIFRESQLFFEVNQVISAFFVTNKIKLAFSISVKEEAKGVTISLRVNNSTTSAWLKIEQEAIVHVIHQHLQKKDLIQSKSVINILIK